MAIFNEFPQTNFHELNLDWIIKVLRDLQKEWETFGLNWDEELTERVDEWLTAHPEATTTVQDHSLDYNKMVLGTLGFVIPEFFGAVGDGVQDDTAAFTAAFNFANDNNIPLYLLNKTYSAKNITATRMPSLHGVDGSALEVGNRSFLYSDDFVLDNITFISDFAVDKTGSITSFLRPDKLNTDHVYINNVKFNALNADDTKRGYIFIRLACDAVNINDLVINGAWNGIIFNNNANISPETYIFDNITGYNVQTLIDIEGYVNSSDMSGNIKNVSINNVTLINTTEQGANYTRIVGSDCLLISNVENFNISNICSINAAERGLYGVNLKAGSISNVIVKGSEGVKIAGTILSNGYILSEDVNIDNVRVFEATNGYAILFYQVHGISVNGLVFENQADVIPNYCIGLTGVTSNVYINGVRGFNAGRGLLYIYKTNGWNNNVAKISLNDVDFDNPITASTYSAIRIEGDTAIFARDITLENVAINRAAEGFYSNSSRVNGLINADWCEDLIIKNCLCRNINTLGTGIVIGDNCNKVSVYGDYECSLGIVKCDFKANKGIFTVFANTARNNFNVIQRYNFYSAALVIPDPYEIAFKSTGLLYRAPLYLYSAIQNYIIDMVSNQGYLKGYSSQGTFTLDTSGGSFGTATGNLRFASDTLALESYVADGESTVAGKITLI